MPPRRAAGCNSDRASKLTKLGDLRCSLPFVSQRALAALLTYAQNEGLPQSCSRADIRAARGAVARQETPYGTLHQTIHIDGYGDIEVLHPFAALGHASHNCAGFKTLIERATVHQGPLNVILYADEVLSGNQLAHKAARKTWCWYWTIAEFGPSALTCEDPRLHLDSKLGVGAGGWGRVCIH